MASSRQLQLGPMALNGLSGSSSPPETDRKTLAGALFTRALSRAGISQKEAAICMGLSEGQLSRQIAGSEHLSLQRCLLLPVTFWMEFLALLAEHHGIALQTGDRRRLAIGQALIALGGLVAALDGDRP